MTKEATKIAKYTVGSCHRCKPCKCCISDRYRKAIQLQHKSKEESGKHRKTEVRQEEERSEKSRGNRVR